jgi:hypothetical protein
VWDDEAVEALLHRGEASDSLDSPLEKKDSANDYLSSFKIAQYVTRENGEAKPAAGKLFLKS